MCLLVSGFAMSILWIMLAASECAKACCSANLRLTCLLLLALILCERVTAGKGQGYRFIGFIPVINGCVSSPLGVLVELLSAIGLIFGLSDTILGLTVLAWGNSAGDLVANTAVARDGFPIMALAAVYSGPLFNACIGLGLSLTVKGSF